MRIFTYIKFDINGNVINEDSFIYNGEIAECKGGAPTPPPPTAAEEELTGAQTELIYQQIEQLTQQNEMLQEMMPNIQAYLEGQIEFSQLQLEAQQQLLPLQTSLAEQGIELNALQMEAMQTQLETSEALRPALMEAVGYELDESGNYVAVEGEQDPLLAQLEERYTGALAGEAEVSPYMESQLADERTKLEEDLSRRLGPNWASTTPGIQALSDFDTRADLLREEARQSTIASAGTQYMSARGQLAGERQQRISNIAGLMGGGGGGIPTSIGGGGGGGIPAGLMGGGGGGAGAVSSSIANLREYYQKQRYDPWLAQQGQQAGRSQAMLGGAAAGAMIGTGTGGPGVGTAIGAGVGLLAGYLLS